MISSPQLIQKPHPALCLSIVLEDFLSIPLKLADKGLVRENLETPVPDWSKVDFKFIGIVIVLDLNCTLLKLKKKLVFIEVLSQVHLAHTGSPCSCRAKLQISDSSVKF